MAFDPSTEFLADPDCYLREIERLGRRWRRREAYWEARQWDASLGELWASRAQLAQRLAAAVQRGEYRLGSVQVRAAQFDGKQRILHRFGWIDQVVVSVLARGLSALAEPMLPDALHAYRKGRSTVTALRALQAYLADHRRSRPLRERGLYVLRRDVEAYGERIPNDVNSSLWPALAHITAPLADDLRPVADGLLLQALRPEVRHRDGTSEPMQRGTPTGSPLQPLVNNLYLADLDRAMLQLEGGLYLRFGDDILFAHPDAAQVRAAEARLTRGLVERGLAAHPDKRANVYWTGCGRPSPGWPLARGSSQIEFLGYRVDFKGRIALKPQRVQLLIRDLERRWCNTLALSPGADARFRRKRLCRVTAKAFEARYPLHTPAVSQLHAVNDRAHLKQLDFAIALALAERLSGRRGVRAFRHEPYRGLRLAGLPSLVVMRNRGWKPRSQGSHEREVGLVEAPGA